MSRTDRRSKAEIRAQLEAERVQLDSALAGLREDAKQAAKLAGTAMTAISILKLVAALRRRRRRRRAD